MPDIEALWNGTVYNSDGHGFAIIIDGKIRIGRGWSAFDMINEFAGLRRKNLEYPAIFHSRLATHGITTKDNIHPFVVGRDTRTVIAHNGIFNSGQLGLPVGHYKSDTRYWAEDFLPRARKMNLLRAKGRARAAQWMGTYNKVAGISLNPDRDATGFILNERSGEWEEGIWYSNDDYLGKPRYASTFVGRGNTAGGWIDDYDDNAYWDDDERYAAWLQDHSYTQSGDKIVKGEPTEIGYPSSTQGTRTLSLDEVLDQLEDAPACMYCEAKGTVSVYTDICSVCSMCNACSQYAAMCQCFNGTR